MNMRFVNCEACQGEGRVWLRPAGGIDPDEYDAGECEECLGECVVLADTQLIDMEDLP